MNGYDMMRDLAEWTKERSSTMKRNDLTADERIIYMPTWERVALGAFCALLPILGSIVAISF